MDAVPASRVVAVASDGEHRFGKACRESITLVRGLGVEGDAHAGKTVQHRSRVAADPTAPNLRQVHLLQSELIDELAAGGFAVSPGALGENVTTCGIDILVLPRGTRLRLGGEALVEVTGLRNPCRQIDDNIGPGAMAAVLDRRADGSLVRRAGVMAVVIEGGRVKPGDPIAVASLPDLRLPLGPV